ncbi:MAG: S41 family peptidase [Bacteroidales bacterium]|nr:S41 family peptidase [Bacteroidales bacterium]
MSAGRSSIITTSLGVVIGVLLVLVISSITRSNKINVSSGDWAKLNVVLNAVRGNYVDEVNTPELTEAALVAALAKLDPHSVYLPPMDTEESESELAGRFDGIGIQFNVPNDTAIVLEIIPGGPAEKAGLLPGDRLLKVDDKVIAGVKFPQDSMVRRIKGPSGTKVHIDVLRDGEKIFFDLVRAPIPLHSVDAYLMADDTTGYIRLTKFAATTFQEVTKASADLLSKGMKRLILDLRGNSGGYFNQALLLSNLFLDKGRTIVYLQGLHRKKEIYTSDGRGILRSVPLTIMIDESSASSSEILAGAIQDNDRGVVVGRRSYGKGLVQEPLFFTDGSAVRISVARYYTPSGRCIQRPYRGDDEYNYDFYRRYAAGELFSRDSIKADTSEVYKTLSGRTVYGGGGIIPDIYVPMDTTHATQFHVKVNRRALQMRFASRTFDLHKHKLSAIDNYSSLESFFENIDLSASFLKFAASDGVVPKGDEWKRSREFILPLLKALIARYSKMGQEAYYKMLLPIDDTFEVALSATSRVSELSEDGTSTGE